MMIDETQEHNLVPCSPRKRSRSRGQSIVEFALVLPILLGFLVIAADFGRAFTAYLTISSAAREGATYASRSDANADKTTAITETTLAEVGTSKKIWNVAPTVVVANQTTLKDPQGYRYVEVRVDYTFEPMFAIWPIPGDVPMQRTVRMRVLGS